MTSHFTKLMSAQQVTHAIGTVSLTVLQFFLPLDLSSPSSLNTSSLITSGATANAAESIRYTPPKRGGFKRSDGTGARGEESRMCGKVASVPLTLLVPNDHDGRTISARPTFFWYLANPQTVKFKLVEPGARKPVFVKSMRVDKSGIVKLELPKDAPELIPDRDYRWSISVVCRSEQDLEDAVALSFIRRVSQTPELSRQLATAKSDQSRAEIYAAQGLWYDALATLSRMSTTDLKNQSIQNSVLSLLDQAGLIKVTAQERKKLSR